MSDRIIVAAYNRHQRPDAIQSLRFENLLRALPTVHPSQRVTEPISEKRRFTFGRAEDERRSGTNKLPRIDHYVELGHVQIVE